MYPTSVIYVDRFDLGQIWNSTLPNSLLIEQGQVYYLKVSYYVQGDMIYGISNMFSIVNASTCKYTTHSALVS